jgi:hypothetical protein
VLAVKNSQNARQLGRPTISENMIRDLKGLEYQAQKEKEQGGWFRQSMDRRNCKLQILIAKRLTR